MEKYTSLARKYRPQKFEDLFGQDVARRILQNSIATKLIHHAYIFSGMRGTGKTTAARIFAKALNCVRGPTPDPCNSCENCESISKGNFIDVVEMDAGSQTSVDDIRAIREMALYPPIKGRYKLFILDEAHMLSQSAFNALLKIFEEPPDFDIFILATTEPHKIPETVQSRAIRVDFTRIPKAQIIQRLKDICEMEGIEYEYDALRTIAEESEGSMRDAISILESVWMFSGKGKISQQEVASVFGIAPTSVIYKLIKYSILGDTKKVSEILDGVIEKGYNIKRICKTYAELIKDICLFLEFSHLIPEELHEIVKETGINLEHALSIANLILRFENDLRFSLSEEVALKMFFLKICYSKRIRPLAEMISDIKNLMQKDNSQQKGAQRNPIDVMFEYFALAGNFITLEKIKNSEQELVQNNLIIRTDDVRLQNIIAEKKKDIERYIREQTGRTIRIQTLPPDKKLDVEKVLGDEMEELRAEIKMDDTSPT